MIDPDTAAQIAETILDELIGGRPPAGAPTWPLSRWDALSEQAQLETCGFIRDMPRVGLDSYDKNMQKNVDGSVDIYIGPKPPAGKEANWIQTASGRNWFPIFRFYGPEKPLFARTWKLPEIEHVR